MSSPDQKAPEILTELPREEFDFDKAAEASENVIALAEVCFDGWKDEQHRLRKLKDSPKGFHLDGTYMCAICYNHFPHDENWYDQYGIKCMSCQGAIDRGEIPPTAVDRDTWYCEYNIESDFCLDRYIVRRWVKAGLLKERVVKNPTYSDTHLLLIEDNKETLPPKELVKSQSIAERTSDGHIQTHSEPWYRFVDPFEHLKGYKIMEYLQFVNGKLEPKPEFIMKKKKPLSLAK